MPSVFDHDQQYVEPLITQPPCIISVTGPESSGKTTLTRSLAHATGGIYVPEFARDYLNAHGPHYNIDDLITIAQQQFTLMQDAISHAKHTGQQHVICDTDMTVMNIWADEKFGIVPQEILELRSAESFDLILLCDPGDVPWEPDPLRENPYDRSRLFDRYRLSYDQLHRDYRVMQGSPEVRLERALKLTKA
ncbi:MAG: ATP-binding protein [Flavobacteriales bacterium]|nr:ATP-binding protein [Flavobacteriales bacterium]